MPIPRRLQLLSIPPLLMAISCLAQDAATMSPKELAGTAFTHFNAAILERQHYTYEWDRDYRHGDIDDKQVDVTKVHGDVVAIEGHLYLRSLHTADGEQTRQQIDDLQQKAKIVTAALKKISYASHTGVVPARDHLPDGFVTDFAHRVIGHEQVQDRDCIMLESMPPDNIHEPEAQNQIRLWIDSQTFEVLRFRWESLVDVYGVLGSGVVTTLKGRTSTIDYQIVNQHAQPVEEVFDWREVYPHGERTHTRMIDKYDNYQRFTATVTMKPMGETGQPQPPNPSH